MALHDWLRVCFSIAATTAACGGESVDSRDWPGTVEADVDDLTGARTGLFRTYGPTTIIVAGPDTVPVTVGYWCQVEDVERQPLTAVDGMFLKIALPDTSLTSSGAEAFVELRGTLGLLDLARMAVDGNVSPWRYDPMPEVGAWYLDGAMGFVPDGAFDSRDEREELVSALGAGYDLAGDLVETSSSSGASRLLLEETDELVSELRSTWAPATDYVASHYYGRDTLGVELKGVVKFSLRGFSAAADSVRFWCPVPQSHHEWNAARVGFFGRIDSLQSASAAKIASLRVERERRVASLREEGERRAADERAAQERARGAAQARADSVSAEEAQRAQEEDSIRALGLRTYTVRSGDSLWEIARAHGVTADRLRSFNNLSSSRLYAGQVLRIPPKG